MEISYDYYRVFYYVAKQKSLSGAASVLGNNQPNITKCMNNLEAQLGCKLLVRSNRGVSLTPEGEKLYAHVSIAYEQFREAELELANDKSLQSGVLTVAASETALHGVLLPALSLFRSKYPGIRIKISNHSTSQALNAIGNGLADFCVVTTPTDAPIHFKETTLLNFSEILVTGKDFASITDLNLTAEDILSYPIVGLGQNTKTFDFYTQLFGRLGLSWKPDTEAATADQLIPLIENGLGIGFVPEFLAKEPIDAKRIQRITNTGIVPMREIRLIEDKTRHLSIAANELKKLLMDTN